MTQPTSESKLDELKRLCEPMNGEPMRTVTRLELETLVECADQLRHMRDIKAIDYDYDDEQFRLWAQNRARHVLDKLEAL